MNPAEAPMGNERRVPRLVVRLAEPVAALVLVLVFFMVFLGILGLSFPEGTNLADLMRGGESAINTMASAFDLGRGSEDDR